MGVLELDKNTFIGDNDKRVKFNFVEDDVNVFYVRFFDEKDVEEFKEIEKLFGRIKNPPITISERHGTYRVASVPSENQNAWNILMHKYWILSNEIRKDDETQMKYYPIEFSDTHILPCDRRMVV